ncbi:MAG: hypothetical protein HOL01_05795 [Planctomycetaceae bacterium]|nr:hypothetical protein [Planctomycetaceae bacterium]MBT6486720.1 hypothetical protein [Planctomycetaceae bacterium]MBT6494049.1 hypothetical protein [Planctomycetaceae bacterium]
MRATHALLFVSVVVVAGVRPAAAADKMDLATIRTAVSFYTDSVKTLEGRYHDRSTYQPKKRSPSTVYFEDERRVIDFAADVPNGRWSTDTSKSFSIERLSPDRFESRDVSMFDGQESYQLSYTLAKAPFIEFGPPPGVPDQLTISSGAEGESSSTPLHFAGLRLRHSQGGMLASALQSGKGRLEGLEEIDGHDCYRIEVEFGSLKLIVWLDPQHDFLPRRQEYRGGGKEHDWKMLAFLFETLEFKQFADAAHGNQRWFPQHVKTTFSTDMKHEIELIELQINPPLKITHFQVDAATLPDGVKLVNYKTPQKATFTGGRRDLWEARQKLVDAHDERCHEVLGESAKSDDPIRANPLTSGGWLAWLVGLGSLAVLTLGIRLLMRNRRATSPAGQ